MAIGFAERAVQREFAKIAANPGSIGALTNGWVNPSPKIGNFGTEYKLRAGISLDLEPTYLLMATACLVFKTAKESFCMEEKSTSLPLLKVRSLQRERSGQLRYIKTTF
jgi:hypothetical protein